MAKVLSCLIFKNKFRKKELAYKLIIKIAKHSKKPLHTLKENPKPYLCCKFLRHPLVSI